MAQPLLFRRTVSRRSSQESATVTHVAFQLCKKDVGMGRWRDRFSLSMSGGVYPERGMSSSSVMDYVEEAEHAHRDGIRLPGLRRVVVRVIW